MPKPAQSGHQADIAAALYERSGAAAYGVSVEQFAAILDEILRKYFPQNSAHDSDPNSRSRFSRTERRLLRRSASGRTGAGARMCRGKRAGVAGLHQPATGRSCTAWRCTLRATPHMPRSWPIRLFADLYGVNTRDGVRNSKLVFYTGRGSLEGWLRTVMAQEFINRYRKQKRTVSLEEQTEEGVQFAAAVPGASA